MKKLNISNIHKELNYIDPQEKQIIQTNITKPMSDSDILDYLGHYNEDDIIMYSDLHKYNDIDELLPKPKPWKIILIRNEPTSGHWSSLMKYQINGKTIIESFNSYGIFPSSDMKFIPADANDEFDQHIHWLNKLLMTTLNKNYYITKNNFNSLAKV